MLLKRLKNEKLKHKKFGANNSLLFIFAIKKSYISFTYIYFLFYLNYLNYLIYLNIIYSQKYHHVIINIKIS